MSANAVLTYGFRNALTGGQLDDQLQAPPMATALPTPKRSHPLVDELRRETLDTLDSALARMFDRAGDTLLDMSNQAESEAERHAHFDAMRVLSFEQATILRSLRHELSRAFGAAVQHALPMSGGGVRLAQLPGQELEDGLALAQMTSRLKSAHRDKLQSLEQRLQALERDLGLPPVAHAVSPRRFCEAWSLCLHKLDLSYGIYTILLKLFERTALDALGRIYRDLHEALDRHAPRTDAPAASAPRAKTIEEARRQVSDELGALIQGRQLHPGARRFLGSALAPLMCARLLRDGAASARWFEMLDRAALILRTLEPQRPGVSHQALREQLLAGMDADLRGINFTPAQIAPLLDELRGAYAALDQDSTSGAIAA